MASPNAETLLGVIAAYLPIGMLFAFAYSAVCEFRGVRFFSSAGHGTRSLRPGQPRA